jgi:RNA polymerase-binding transcription factor DksA
MNNGKMDKVVQNERLGRLHAQLFARERRLFAGLCNVEQEDTRNVLNGADAMEAASESAANDLVACLRGLRTVELVEINDAFQKFVNGTYGTCERCGKRIPEARLRLIPAASLCVGCKRGIERRTGNPPDLPEWSCGEAMADVEKSESLTGQTGRRV